MSKETDIQQNVLERIHNGGVEMRPKAYFTLRTVLFDIAMIALFLLALFALSFVFFAIQENDEQYLLGFGGRGLAEFVMLFPWLMLAAAVILLGSLEALLRRIKFGYRVPIVRLFLATIIVGIVGGIVLQRTPLHSSLLQSAEQGELPGIGRLYEQIYEARQSRGVYSGRVTGIGTTTFTIIANDNHIDRDDGTWTIEPPPGFDLRSLSTGEEVYSAGVAEGRFVRAYGIRTVAPD